MTQPEERPKIRMVEQLKRNSFPCLLVALAAMLLAALSSCGSPAGGAKRPAAEQESPAGEKIFARIGSRSITEAVRAESFVLSRCLFLDQGHLTHISLQAQLSQAPEAARAELDALLAGLQGRRAEHPGNEPGPASPVRIYQLQP